MNKRRPMSQQRRREQTRIYEARRDERAKALGWRSRGQQRYWTAIWSPEVARRLGVKCCGGRLESERAGSVIPCKACNDRVHPKGESLQGVDWRARLVNAAEEA
jgi:hypothetical protein